MLGGLFALALGQVERQLHGQQPRLHVLDGQDVAVADDEIDIVQRDAFGVQAIVHDLLVEAAGMLLARDALLGDRKRDLAVAQQTRAHVMVVGVNSFGVAWDMLEGLATGWGEASPLVTSGVVLAIVVGIGSQYLPARIPRLVMARFSRLPVLGQATVLAFSLVLTSVLGPEGVAPFIYFQF